MLTVRRLGAEDLGAFREQLRLFERVFEMKDFVPPPDEHLRSVLADDDFIAMVAEKEGTVVGGLTAYILRQYYMTRPTAYVYDLAVETARQRQGIGLRLMAELREHCRARGCDEVFVQADNVDVHALRFYRKSGASEEAVTHFTYSL